MTFSLPADEGKQVEICGEWNDWKPEPMKVKKSGEFYITKVLNTEETYQFGYRIDGREWQSDAQLASVPSPFGSRNSLLEL